MAGTVPADRPSAHGSGLGTADLGASMMSPMAIGDRETSAVAVEPGVAPAPAAPDGRAGGWAARRFFVWLAVIAVVALGVRIAYLAMVDVRIGLITDASNYHLLAN